MVDMTFGSVTNSQPQPFLARVAGTVSLWRRRARERAELTRFTDRDLQDIGVTWCDVEHELRKPFWQS